MRNNRGHRCSRLDRRTDKRPSTAHFKVVPETRELRDRVRAEAGRVRARPSTAPGRSPSRHSRSMAEELLRRLGLGEQYLGFTMVCLTNEFWREQVSGHRLQAPAAAACRTASRTPRAARPTTTSSASIAGSAAPARVADFKTKAEDLGYKVLVSEGTPIVLKIIVSGHVDAIVGVACLNVLEKAIDKMLLAGIPCVAAPLLSSNCRSTSVDDDWVSELIDLQTPPPEAKTQDLRPPDACRASAVRGAGAEPAGAADADRAARRNGQRRLDPLAMHENIAYDWLAQGGKRSRPFITLAAYDALKGAPGTLLGGELRAARLPSGARPWPSRRSTRRRWSTTTSRTTTPSATAGRRCTASTASARPSTSAIT